MIEDLKTRIKAKKREMRELLKERVALYTALTAVQKRPLSEDRQARERLLNSNLTDINADLSEVKKELIDTYLCLLDELMIAGIEVIIEYEEAIPHKISSYRSLANLLIKKFNLRLNINSDQYIIKLNKR